MTAESRTGGGDPELETASAGVGEPESAGGPTDGPEAAVASTDLATRISELEEQLAEATRQKLYDRAEVENYKRRVQREKSEALRFAVEPLVRDLLPIVDNLERAIGAGAEAAASASLLEGVQMVLKSCQDTLARHGVTRIVATGQPFDPSLHQALAHVDSPTHAANVVMEEHLSGYLLHDRLLRAAMVTVSRGPGETAAPSPETH